MSGDGDRTAHWRGRLLALGGGYLPAQVATLLREMPGVGPLPPLKMMKTQTGWLAQLATVPDDTVGTGPSPADAVAALLAKVENNAARGTQ